MWMKKNEQLWWNFGKECEWKKGNLLLRFGKNCEWNNENLECSFGKWMKKMNNYNEILERNVNGKIKIYYGDLVGIVNETMKI